MQKVETIEEVVRSVENEKRFVFDVDDVLLAGMQAARKIELNGKGNDYFPPLFRNELEDIVMRYEINAIGRTN